MMRRNPNISKFTLFFIAVAWLTGCENIIAPPTSNNDERNVNISSNAALVAYREPDGDWVVPIFGNTAFSPSTNSFLVNNSRRAYTAMFACPSGDRGTAHRIYFYFGTVEEMREIKHQCRKAEAVVQRNRVFGNIIGVDVNQGQKARLALGQNRGEWVYEAYAFEDIAGAYDLVGFIASESSEGVITPTRFFKRQSVTLDELEPARVDLDFNSIVAGNLRTSLVPQTSYSSATVSDIPAGVEWKSSITFRSSLRSFLTLAEGAVSPLSFFAFPQYVEGGGSLTEFQKDDEGHEFAAEAYDANNNIVRSVSHFFKEPDDDGVNVRFATASLSGQDAGLVEHEDGIQVTTNWNSLSDSNYNNANLYHWIVRGSTANAPTCANCGGVDSKMLEWHIIVTPSWFATQSGSLKLDLPPIVDISERWSPTWNFSISTSLAWELRAYFADVDFKINPLAANFTAQEGLMNHLFNREFVNGLTYAQVVARNP